MRSVRILLGVLVAGLGWAGAGSAVPEDTQFFGPVDLTDTTPRQVYWQTETTPCEGNDSNGPDGLPDTGDEVEPEDTVFILDAGCAVRAPDAGAVFRADPEFETDLGLPPGSISNGFLADLTFEDAGATAVVTVPNELWGPFVKNNVDTPGLVTVDASSVSDYVFEIDVASGDPTSFSWSGDADTVLGPAVLGVALLGSLPGECDGNGCGFYSAEATASPGAGGAAVWACGTGGFLAQPNNLPGADPGSFGSCAAGGVPGGANPSPPVSNAPYDPANATIFANARSVVLGLTPKAWAPLDGRLSEVPEPAHLLMLCAGAATLALAGRRRRSA